MINPLLQTAPAGKAPTSLTATDQLRLEMLTSLETYTRAMFRAQYNRSFTVNDHHRQLFDALEAVVDGDIKRLIINMPPRYSKTEVCVKSFVSWCYALNASGRFLHLSYSDMLVNDNSTTIRQIMQEPLYTALFPDSALEKEKGATNRWRTRKGGEFYAVSTQGQVTGFGAGKVDDPDLWASDFTDEESGDDMRRLLGLIGAKQNVFEGAIIIDDPVKPEDALSDTVRERINQRFENTIRNRVNSRNTPIIIIMQRLHEHDLCGYLLEKEPEQWTVLSLPAIVTEQPPSPDEEPIERALWPLKHSLEELRHMRSLDTLVFDTQYMQDPKPKEGLMYSSGFRTYALEQLPRRNDRSVRRLNYTDTADTGADHLCSICFIDTTEYIYIVDVLFTDKPMEVTEPEVAAMLTVNTVEMAKIESNNGGRGFKRNAEVHLRKTHRNMRTQLTAFTQTSNKFSRIFSASAVAQNIVLMPEGWERRWPRFHSALMSYRKDNRRRSQHDDAPDALTGVVEMHSETHGKRKLKQKN